MTMWASPADRAFLAAFAFLAGAFAANLAWNAALVLGVAALCAAIAYWCKFLPRIAGAILFAALICGMCYCHAYLAWKAHGENLPLNTTVTFPAIVTDEPQPAAHSRILKVRAEPPLRGSVEILAPPYNRSRYGDRIVVRGKLRPPDEAGSMPFMVSPQVAFVSAHHGLWLREKMIDLKLALIARFKALLAPDNAAFLAGVLFGAKGDLTPTLKGELSVTGTTHLVAVSGYKITLVLFAVGIFLRRFLSRRATFLGTAFCLALFILMVGNAASAVRAALMGFLALVAHETGEEFHMRNAITCAAFIMVLADPTVLTHDLSFIISFASVLGIVYLGPSLQKLFRYADPGIFAWKEAAITTLAAQLATVPVLVNAFGQFSFVAIPANVLTLSLLPLTMVTGFGLAAAGSLAGPLAFAAAKMAGLLLSYQLGVIRALAGFAAPLPISFNSQFIIGSYYLVLVVFIVSYGSNREPRVYGNLQKV